MSEAVWQVIEAASETVVAPPLLMPSDIFVDLAGEEFRKRLFTTEDADGRTLCLRPDFTIPVCTEHLASGRTAPATYAYRGKVFRKRRATGEPEFTQAGTEWIGHGGEMVTDAKLFALAMRCADAAGIAPTIRVGDAHIFDALTKALPLTPGWRDRLASAFGDPQRLDAALARLSRRGAAEGFAARLAPALAKVDAAQARAIVDAVIGLPAAVPAGGRTDADIAERLIEQASAGDGRHAASVVARFLTLSAPLDQAAETLADFARAERLDIAPAIEAFATRTGALAGEGVATHALTFDAAFGRRIGYYTGFVFEMVGEEAEVIAGGRYDRLMALLDPSRPEPGIGFSVWFDRLPGAGGAP